MQPFSPPKKRDYVRIGSAIPFTHQRLSLHRPHLDWESGTVGVNCWSLKLIVVKGVADQRGWLLFLWWPRDEHLTVPQEGSHCSLMGQQLKVGIPCLLWLWIRGSKSMNATQPSEQINRSIHKNLFISCQWDYKLTQLPWKRVWPSHSPQPSDFTQEERPHVYKHFCSDPSRGAWISKNCAHVLGCYIAVKISPPKSYAVQYAFL